MELHNTRPRRLWLALSLLLCAACACVAMAPRMAMAETHSGTWGTVDWSLDTDTGELHFKPTNGIEGTLASNDENSIRFWPWYQYRSSVKSITSEGMIHATGNLFDVFHGCSSLVNVDGLASWDTSSVTDMSDTFDGCSSLANVDGLASWDTSKVTDMSYAFSDCPNLTNVDGLASWDTSSVTDMSDAFDGCYSLASLSMENWDTSKVTNTDSMFDVCSRLFSVTLGPKVTSSVIQQLPRPSTAFPYNGKWVRVDGYGPYTPFELQNLSAADRTGTWVWNGADLTPYVVSFDANGATGSVASLQVSPFVGHVTIPDGSSLVRPDYDFVSWNTKADGTGTAYLPGRVKAPLHNETTGKPAAAGDTVILYAIWRRELPKSVDYRGGMDLITHANEQVTINGLPAGATYVITETPVPSGWTLAHSNNTTGIIMPTVV